MQELSEAKARQTAQQMAAQTKEDTLVIGADTIVVYHGQILGKPEDEADAVKTLAMLQGNTHQVYTGVTLLRKQEIPGKDIPLRNVRMSLSILYPRKKSEIMFPQAIRWIRREVMEYRPFGIYVRGIRGDYNNVVGLPVARLFYEAKKHGIDLKE